MSAHSHKQALDELEAVKKRSAEQQAQLTGMRESLDREAAQRKAAEEQAASLAKERETSKFDPNSWPEATVGRVVSCPHLRGLIGEGGKVARFGDNMREVAVTEGDKVDPKSSSAIPPTATELVTWSNTSTTPPMRKWIRSSKPILMNTMLSLNSSLAARGMPPCAMARVSNWGCADS